MKETSERNLWKKKTERKFWKKDLKEKNWKKNLKEKSERTNNTQQMMDHFIEFGLDPTHSRCTAVPNSIPSRDELS